MDCVDHRASYVFIRMFIAFHIIIIIWLYVIPLKHRKKVKQNDIRYRTLMLEKMKGINNQSFQNQENRLSDVARLTIEN